MRLDNKGYSIVEMFAVIFIVSAILFPLITTLVNNIETNARFHNRRSAVSLAQGTIEGFERMDFVHIDSLITTANNNNDYFIQFDSTNCSQLHTDDIPLCTALFDASWSNFTVDSDDFKVFIYNYNLTLEMQDELTTNTQDIPLAVRNHIAELSTSNDPNPDLYYIVAWVHYDEESDSNVIIEGLISND